MDIRKIVNELKDELIELRRDFHQHPELGFEEYRTSDKVAKYLEGCGLEVKTGIAHTGVTGFLKGDQPGKTVMLRADMDALPVQEKNEVEYKSLEDGLMHACGHDGHTAMLLVAAKILAKQKDKICGNVLFIFQPNEEVAGALEMINEGVLADYEIDAAFSQHLWTPLASGEIGVSGGAVMGGLHEFRVTVEGNGGHTSAPHQAADPVLTAADIINSVQMIQTRQIDPLKSTAIMFGMIKGGTKTNIIPEEVELEGTIRFLYKAGPDSEERPKERFEEIIEKVCLKHGTNYKIEYLAYSPPVYNNPDLAHLVQHLASEVVGGANVTHYYSLAGEDFSEFSDRIPSVFFFIGTGNKAKGTDYPHHHPKFNIDEESLITGVEMHVRTVLNYLSGKSLTAN